MEPFGLSKQCIDEFKQLARDDFGLELNDSDAAREALRVLELFWNVLMEEDPSNSKEADDLPSILGH